MKRGCELALLISLRKAVKIFFFIFSVYYLLLSKSVYQHVQSLTTHRSVNQNLQKIQNGPVFGNKNTSKLLFSSTQLLQKSNVSDFASPLPPPRQILGLGEGTPRLVVNKARIDYYRSSPKQNFPKKNVVFIKLQKVGGSTLRSILQRYASEHRLNLASPRDKKVSRRHVFAHHSTLQAFLENPVVNDPSFVTLLRSPLEHACSFFYWNWHTKKFRVESSGNFSTSHLHYLAIYAYQKKTHITDNSTGERTNVTFKRQWEWFAQSPDMAIDALVRLNFTIGFMENFDRSLLIIRRRLGWPVRQILFLSLNHFRHLTPADWPPAIRAAMNATLAPDWDFHARARALWHEQVRAYGEQRLQRDADGFEELRRLLVEACGGEQLEERGRREFVTACVFNSQQPDCTRQRKVLQCMLQVYDACLAGSRLQFIAFRINPDVDCARITKLEAELDADLEEEP